MSHIIGMTSPIGNSGEKKEVNDLQMPYPEGMYGKSRRKNTLPSNVAIPVGLAQVFIGLSMVLCGSLALRYRSYLFYYGTGLWAGTISGITGALIVMATKEGLSKPRWLCGGDKWQIHMVIAATMLALTASVLMSIFSTSGLMQDTMHSVGVDLGTQTKDEETFERRKSAGVVINAILLLLGMLEILLSFCSLGIGLRILCGFKSSSSLFSADSAGSEVTIHDILGSGPEYEVRKDRLHRWLKYQRRNFFMSPTSAQSQNIQNHQVKAAGSPNVSPSIRSGMTRMGPHLVALKPPQLLIPHHPQTGHPPPRPVFFQHHTLTRPYNYPVMVQVPLCPAPVRRSITPLTDGAASKRRRMEHRSSESQGSLSSGSKHSKRSNRSANHRRRAKDEAKIQEVKDEDIGKTYTGLDRVLAEDFISNSMDKY